MGGMAGGYAPVSPAPRFEAPAAPAYRTPSPNPPARPAFRGSGMRLGGSRRGNDLISQLGQEAELEPEPTPEPEPEPETVVSADVLDKVDQDE
jgi:hypothetical protein